MAKKTPAKKTEKKTVKKKSAKAASSPGTAKKSTAKTASKKKATKKPVAKKPATKKPAVKKAPAKAAGSKAGATKPSSKTKPSPKKSSPKIPSAAKEPAATDPKPAAPTAKKQTKKSAAKAPAPKKAEDNATPKPAATTPASSGDDASKKKSGRKGITVVDQPKKPGPKASKPPKYVIPERPMLLGPGSKLGKPLIPSGPQAPKQTSIFDEPKSKRKKSPLTKTKLEKYRLLLLAKRAELFGDVESMENEALRSGTGGLSHTPQHIAEQGSDSYDQTLSLNLAAKDRRLIKEIDDALKRIEEGTYGLCELTSQPIPEDRLDELPWARYTIEAAREIERRGLPS
ncbi:MAG: TraR/DksA family transcriptional regulator [Planctomycetota bacterium]|nr:MAG: TraR/DksA family transcriptional regulator [Planctomycetota bacterium]